LLNVGGKHEKFEDMPYNVGDDVEVNMRVMSDVPVIDVRADVGL
jgi:hypothetical protein